MFGQIKFLIFSTDEKKGREGRLPQQNEILFIYLSI